MPTRSELEFLEYAQDEAELIADEAEAVTGMERREFVFLSLVTAAASTFGFGARALAQGVPAAGQAPQPTPLPPLGNGEPISWTFQPYPGGTGALMEKLVRERGPAAFQRATFTVPKWTGAVPNDPETIAFLPAHRLVGAHQGAQAHVDAAHAHLPRSDQAARPDAALRRDHHGRPGSGRGGAGG